MTYYVIVCTKQFTYLPVSAFEQRGQQGPPVGSYAAFNEDNCDGPAGLASLCFRFTQSIFDAARFSSEDEARSTLQRMHPYKSDCFGIMIVTLEKRMITTCR